MLQGKIEKALTAASQFFKSFRPGLTVDPRTGVSAEKSATVVIPENAEPSTRLSVEELTNYVSKITGVTLPVLMYGTLPTRLA